MSEELSVEEAVVDNKKVNEFHEVTVLGKTLCTTKDESGKMFVSMTSVSDAIGVDSWRQISKLKKEEKFNPQHMLVVAKDGKEREAWCLPLEELEGWLLLINPKKVKPEVAEILSEFRKRSIRVLYEFWNVGFVAADDEDRKIRSELMVVLEAENETLKIINENLEATAENQRDKIEELKEKNRMAWGRIKNVEKELSSTKEGQLKTLQSISEEHIKERERLISEGNDIIGKGEKRVQALEGELDSLKEHLEVYRQNSEDQEKDIARLKKKVNFYRLQARSLEREVDDLTIRNRRSSKELDRLSKEEFGELPDS